MVNTRKWLMSKLAPHRYGNRLVHSGDPENPVQVMHRRAGLADMEPHELEAVLRLVGGAVAADKREAAEFTAGESVTD